MWATPTMKSISIHALREEGDDHGFEIQPEAAIFLSTPSARRATPHRLGVVQGQPISIHALREEGDLELYGVPAANIRFLSTPSARRATFGRSWTVTALSYFYPRPPRGGRPSKPPFCCALTRISIHALREEGDSPFWHINDVAQIFLSTPSARRATHPVGGVRAGESDFYPRPPRGGRLVFLHVHADGENFYPRPPRGGRPGGQPDALAIQPISIHALREEGDAGSSCGASCRSRFLSTPSARRATGLPGRSAGRPDNFYPRPPRGGRHQRSGEPGCGGRISIHALREEGDASSESAASTKRQFLSTPSARRATLPRLPEKPYMEISIHALREEGDTATTSPHGSQSYFYPRPPRGGRRLLYDYYTLADLFLSTPSARRATTCSTC